MVEIPDNYTGYRLIYDDDHGLSSLYENPTENIYDLFENEYIGVLSRDTGQPIDRLKWQDGRCKQIFKRPIESSVIGKVKPKNIQQAMTIDMLMDETTTVKTITGTFGSGKTFLSCACAFSMLQQGRFDKIMWIRNNIEVRDSNPIGHLKGAYYDKMLVWAMPLADHMGGKEMLDMYINRGQIEIEHLGFLRGRDIKHTIIFCSDAEHLTREHVQLLLGRVGEGSILILDGDCQQVDARAFERDNGLQAAIDCLKGNRLFSYVHLRESVRSDTAKLADLLNRHTGG
jgi:PhoH-like ATPase